MAFSDDLKSAAIAEAANTTAGPVNRVTVWGAYGSPRSRKVSEIHARVVQDSLEVIRMMIDDGFTHPQIAAVLTSAARTAGIPGYRISGKVFSRTYRKVVGEPAGKRSAGALQRVEEMPLPTLKQKPQTPAPEPEAPAPQVDDAPGVLSLPTGEEPERTDEFPPGYQDFIGGG